MVCKRKKGYKLERPNPTISISTTVAINGVLQFVDRVSLFYNLFRVQRKGGEEKDAVQVQPSSAATGGDCGGQHGVAPPQDAKVQLRSAEAGVPRGGGGGEFGVGLVAGLADASCLGSLPVLVSVFLV